jgi:hypothetical protein
MEASYLSNATIEQITKQAHNIAFWNNPMTWFMILAFTLLIVAVIIFVIILYFWRRDITYVRVHYPNKNFIQYKFRKFHGESFLIKEKNIKGELEENIYDFDVSCVEIFRNKKYIDFYYKNNKPIKYDHTQLNNIPSVIDRLKNSLMTSKLLEQLLKFKTIETIMLLVIIVLVVVIINLLGTGYSLFTQKDNLCTLAMNNQTLQVIKTAITMR